LQRLGAKKGFLVAPALSSAAAPSQSFVVTKVLGRWRIGRLPLKDYSA
jgi:hypothetical protein